MLREDITYEEIQKINYKPGTILKLSDNTEKGGSKSTCTVMENYLNHILVKVNYPGDSYLKSINKVDLANSDCTILAVSTS